MVTFLVTGHLAYTVCRYVCMYVESNCPMVRHSVIHLLIYFTHLNFGQIAAQQKVQKGVTTDQK